jgi:hypothetical protein
MCGKLTAYGNNERKVANMAHTPVAEHPFMFLTRQAGVPGRCTMLKSSNPPCLRESTPLAWR